MFDYDFIKWKRRINIKSLSRSLTFLYVLGIIPMLVLGFYDFPSADDFSMALQTRQYFAQNGNIFGTIWASLVKSYYIYTHYEGYFFSIILTCICPSVFGEFWYFLTPFLILGMLTFGVCYFFDALFVRAWQMDKDLANAFRMLVLIMMVQFINGKGIRVEAFYWYSGAINYTFTFGMAFFWLGLLIRIIYDENNKSKTRKKIWACIWGFFMGGANYLTALELAICSVLILFILFMVKRGIFKFDERAERLNSYRMLWIPTLFNLVGFAFSCFAPGVAYRSQETAHYGAVKSVLLSLFSTFSLLMNNMMRWETIVCLLILVPISWKLAEGLKHRMKHPFMFTLFAYLLVSSNFTPPYFAAANFTAGRLRTLAWMEFIILTSLVVFYITAWARQTLIGDADRNEDKDYLSENASMIIVALACFVILGSGLCVVPEKQYYSATSAAYDLVSGSASEYRRENLERLELLKDTSSESVGLKDHNSKPEMLVYMDITQDTNEWINRATATYYNKKEVYLIPSN